MQCAIGIYLYSIEIQIFVNKAQLFPSDKLELDEQSNGNEHHATMCDYSSLPTLVLNEIFSYLSVREQVKCKSVCRFWKLEIELREKNRDSLVLYTGPYLWNIRWNPANGGRLMKFENSFEIEHPRILEQPSTRRLLKKTKKLAIVTQHMNVYNPELEFAKFCLYFNCFSECEQIEIHNFRLSGMIIFDLPKLKTLVFRDCQDGRNSFKLFLDCPSLEVLFLDTRVKEVLIKTPRSLKRLFCSGWSVKVSSDDKFESLEYLNLFTKLYEPVSERLLDLMPKLKRLVLYSVDLEADLERIRKQRERWGLWQLEVLPAGFNKPVEMSLCNNFTAVVMINECLESLFGNYAKLVENSPWKVWIDYSTLFGKFKILPASFFERFSEFCIEINEVTSYTHLFEFLWCCPYIQYLRIHFSKVKASLILDMMHLLHPSLRELGIMDKRACRSCDYSTW